MSCVTPADLGRPIAAIVERCGAPGVVDSRAMANSLTYFDRGAETTVWFDADQMRARVLQFSASPPATAQPFADWNLTLPFESGAHEIVLGQTMLDDAQGTLAGDADVTTESGAAFRSTATDDVVLAAPLNDRVVREVFVGQRASLVQLGIIARPLDEAPLDYVQPVPRDGWPRGEGTGPRATIFRIDVDARGTVRNVTVVVPSGDGAFDSSMQSRFGDTKFRPAWLDKRPVSGACFVQVLH